MFAFVFLITLLQHPSLSVSLHVCVCGWHGDVSVYNDFWPISCDIITLSSRWGPISTVHFTYFLFLFSMISKDLCSSSLLFMCILILESKITGIRIFHFVIMLSTFLGFGYDYYHHCKNFKNNFKWINFFLLSQYVVLIKTMKRAVLYCVSSIKC